MPRPVSDKVGRLQEGRTVAHIPEQFNDLVLRKKPLLHKILFASSAATLQTIAADPRHLGAQIGFSVLHTWEQNPLFHPHIHYVATGGGVSHRQPANPETLAMTN